MSFTVWIQESDTEFTVEEGQTILTAATEQDISIPFGCRSGNCGSCKVRLESGEVEMSAYSEFALSQSEYDSGLILGCQAIPLSDCEINLLYDETEEIAHPHCNLECSLIELTSLTHDTKMLKLEILSGAPFTFTAGQYVDLVIDGLPARPYSMANRPDQNILEFHIRHVPDGEISTYVMNELRVGAEIQAEGPFGSAYLRENHNGPILAVAGGSGLAPIKSIVETSLINDNEQPIYLYFGVRDERDLYFVDEFLDLSDQYPNLTFIPVLSEPSEPTERRTGLVTDIVEEDFEDFTGFKAYLCGPPPMVEAATVLLDELGVAKEDIHADAFYTQADQAGQLTELCKVDEIPEGGVKRVEVDGYVPVAVYNIRGTFYATDDKCTHGNASLSEGWVDRDEDIDLIECPFHGGSFEIVTGKPLDEPCTIPLRIHQVTIEDNIVFAKINK